MTRHNNRPTAVLVHAAWFDGSSWNKVIADLERRGRHAVAAQLPLTSLTDDVSAVRRLVRRQKGPVILVGHSYGGAVVTAAGDEDNVAVVAYIAAIVPDEGETVGQILGRTPPHSMVPRLEPDADGYLWLTVKDFRNAVAPGASERQTALMAAAQKPINVTPSRQPGRRR